MTILAEIEAAIAAGKCTATWLGLRALNDSSFVFRLRAGRRCWPETEAAVRRVLRELDGEA